MASSEQIFEWKKQYGRLIALNIGQVECVFRSLSYKEYKDASALVESTADIEDNVVLLALLDPTEIDLNKVPAGLVSTIAAKIRDLSGFGPVESRIKVLENKRNEYEDVHGLIKAMILAAMPIYSEEYLDGLTFDALMGKVALSEKIFKVQQSVAGISSEEGVTLQLVDITEAQEVDLQEVAHQAALRSEGEANVAVDPIAQRLQGFR